jgi:hypothetical protein
VARSSAAPGSAFDDRGAGERHGEGEDDGRRGQGEAGENDQQHQHGRDEASLRNPARQPVGGRPLEGRDPAR